MTLPHVKVVEILQLDLPKMNDYVLFLMLIKNCA